MSEHLLLLQLFYHRPYIVSSTSVVHSASTVETTVAGKALKDVAGVHVLLHWGVSPVEGCVQCRRHHRNYLIC